MHIEYKGPLALRRQSQPGLTFQEALLPHVVARLRLHPYVDNIQASYTKLGPQGVVLALNAGVNDLGGTLMNGSISRAAGASFGREIPPDRMEVLILAAAALFTRPSTGTGKH